jgi:hypothetical protein
MYAFYPYHNNALVWLSAGLSKNTTIKDRLAVLNLISLLAAKIMQPTLRFFSVVNQQDKKSSNCGEKAAPVEKKQQRFRVLS